MTIYITNRVKELAEAKMKKELIENGHESCEEYIDTMSKLEFERYFMLKHILPEKEMDKWRFYTRDDVYDYLDTIDEFSREHDLDLEEMLETAKDLGYLQGFIELDTELYMINIGE